MKTSRLSLFLTLLSILLLFTFGSVIRAQDAQELTVTWWGSQARHDRTIELIELFESEHPGLEITYEFSGWGDYWTRVNTQATGGNVACVMQQDYAYLTEWATRDLLMPLDELIESGAIDVSNVDQSVLDSGKVNGETFGISLGTNSQTFILDVDAFEAAGVELPAKDWTWEDFEEISNQIHEASGIWSIAYGPWDDNMMKSVLISSGQWLFSEDGSAIGITEPQVWFDHLARIKRLMDSGAIAPMEEQADIAAAGLEGSPIVEGNEAIRYQWSNQVVALTTAAGEDRNFILHPLPRVSEGQSANYLKPSMFFSITAGCPNPELAAEFINFATNDLEANDILFAERGVPISSEVREYLAEKVDPVTAQIFEFIAEVGEDASPVPLPDPAGWSDVNANVLYPQYIDQVLFGQTTPEEGYDFFVSESNSILAQNAATDE